MEPPTTKLAFASAINQPIQKLQERRNAAIGLKGFKSKTPEDITQVGSAKFDNTVVTSTPPEVEVEISAGPSLDAVQ